MKFRPRGIVNRSDPGDAQERIEAESQPGNAHEHAPARALEQRQRRLLHQADVDLPLAQGLQQIDTHGSELDLLRIGPGLAQQVECQRMIGGAQRGYADRPGIMYFDSCQYCITTIPALGTDEAEPEAPASGGPDHGWDATQFALTANPLPDTSNLSRLLNDDDDIIHRGELKQPEYRGNFGYGGN